MREHNFQLGDRVVYHAAGGWPSTPAYEGLVGHIERIDPTEIHVRWDPPRQYEPVGYCISNNLQLAAPEILTTHRAWLP